MARKGRSRPKRPIQFRGSVGTPIIILIGVASEADSAITIKPAKAISFASETDSALLIHSGGIIETTETDTAQAITRKKLRLLTRGNETDSSQTITKRTGLGNPNETDIALVIIPFVPAPPPTPPPIWRVDLHALNGASALVTGLPVQSWMFSHVLNGPGAFEADLFISHPLVTEANILSGAREIRVYRETSLVWAGYLWSVQASATNYKIRLRGEGYFSRLRRRLIVNDLVKTDRDQAEIAWDLIAYTQSTHGTFGLTKGSIPTGVLIDHVYCATDFPNVGESIEEIASMDDSFDFWVTPTISDASNKVFKNAHPRRGTTKAVTLNQTNAITAEYEIDSADLANHIWGVGNGDCNPPEFEAQDAASIATYGELHDTIQFEDLDHLPSVKAHTREELRLNKQPRRQVTIQMEERDYNWGSFDVGDIVTLASNRGYITDSRQMRVLKIQSNFNPENKIAFFEFDLDSVIA